MDNVDRVTNVLRQSLYVYALLDPPDAARVVIALFGLAHAKHMAPLLEEVAFSIQPVQKT